MKMKAFKYLPIIFFTLLNFLFLLKFREVDIVFIIISFILHIVGVSSYLRQGGNARPQSNKRLTKRFPLDHL